MQGKRDMVIIEDLIEEVNNDKAYFIEDEFGLNELKAAYYWPDSTVSFSA